MELLKGSFIPMSKETIRQPGVYCIVPRNLFKSLKIGYLSDSPSIVDSGERKQNFRRRIHYHTVSNNSRTLIKTGIKMISALL